MAEKRINRRSNAIQKRDPVIPEKITEEEDDEIDKAIIKKSKDATVEVTVKVKKRRDKSDEKRNNRNMLPVTEREYRKGSWGDLLSSSKTNLHNQDNGSQKKKKLLLEKAFRRFDATDDKKKSIRRYGGEEHSPLCQKIPITDDLYLETHTHLVEPKDKDGDGNLKIRASTSGNSLRNKALLQENEDLRDEIDRLRRELEHSKHSRNLSTCIPPRFTAVSSKSHYYDSDQDFPDHKQRHAGAQYQGQTQGTQTSRGCLLSPKKHTVTSTQTTDRGPSSPPKKLMATANTATSPPKKLVATVNTATSPNPVATVVSNQGQLENFRLEKENDALRREAAQLLSEMNKTRQEYLECCNTMKELYEIAEKLKKDNHSLLQNHQQQQTLHSKFLQTLAENREMKEFLETILAEKQKSADGIQDGELAHIRNIVKDVKRAIADELQEFAKPLPKQNPFEKGNDISDTFGLNSLLNDTNASEIQRIFRTSEPPEVPRGNAMDDRSSSTQYLTLGAFSGMDGHFRPSPLANSKFSPRISTPNSSMESLCLSEASSSSNFQIQQPPQAVVQTQTMVEGPHRNQWSELHEQIARSFIPVRNELSNGSSSYNGSTSSSPNPAT